MSSKVSRSALRRRKKNALNVNVAILGLNRISASLGLALRGINDRDNTDIVFTVLGRDEDNDTMKVAQKIGAIDNFNRSLQTVVEEADIVLLDVPMGDLEDLFERLGEVLKAGAVVVDLSPMKQPGVELAKKYFPKDANGKLTSYIVGATPLISFDQIYVTNMDVEAADEFMFRNTDMVISPAASIPAEAVKVVTDIAGFLNMKPRFMDPAEYDGLAALHESLPTLLSVVMFQTVVQSPGKMDVLRVANGTFANAVQLLRHVNAKDLLARWRPNSDALVQQIEQLVNSLESFRQLIESDVKDPMILETYLEQLLHAFVDWEVRREENNWHMEKSSPLDNVQTGVPVIGQMFIRKRNVTNEDD